MSEQIVRIFKRKRKYEILQQREISFPIHLYLLENSFHFITIYYTIVISMKLDATTFNRGLKIKTGNLCGYIIQERALIEWIRHNYQSLHI